MATKTYFTTSTFYTTYIDRQRTVTKTRTNVRSKVVTESYSGGQFDYLPGPVEQTLAPSIQEAPQGPKYLSLGPNIYGLVKTFYATYTYNNGQSGESKEVITQVSTSLFSTTALPASISISRPVEAIASTSVLQLDAESLVHGGEVEGLVGGDVVLVQGPPCVVQPHVPGGPPNCMV